MSNQLARLFLRGSLMNDTAKLLTRDEVNQVEHLMKEAWDDPAIQNQKLEFCMALGRTIGNEYKDVDVGKQDALITFWKAALLVLFHESKQCITCNKHYITTKSKLESCNQCGNKLLLKWSPKPQISKDPIKRKKFFQSVMFNYLRQILRENKPPSMTETTIEDGYATDVAVQTLKKIISSHALINSIEKIDDNNSIINCNTDLLPLKILKCIADVKNDLDQYGVHITMNRTNINILSPFEIPQTINYKITEKVYTKFTSLDTGNSDDDTHDSFRNACEHKIISKIGPDQCNGIEYNETLDILRSRLPNKAQQLFDLITNTPDDYKEKFGDKLYKSNMASYLGINPKDIDELKETIKIQCLAVDIGTNN